MFGRYKRKWKTYKPISRVSPKEFIKLKREALAQPILIDVLEIFSGKVIDIKELDHHGHF